MSSFAGFDERQGAVYPAYGSLPSPYAVPPTPPIAAAATPRPSSARPEAFKYNGRVALALVPNLVVLASFCGPHIAAALLVGFMAVYTLDALRMKEGALGAAWLTLGGANVGSIAAVALGVGGGAAREARLPPALTAAVLAFNAGTLFLVGVWTSLQFRWVAVQHPSVAIAFERLLLGACLPAAVPVQAWAAASLLGGGGPPAVAFWAAALLCGHYVLFALPLAPSFGGGAAAGRRGGAGSGTALGGAPAAAAPRVQAPLDGALAALLLVALPPATHAAVRWGAPPAWLDLWSLLLLGCGPLLLLAALPRGLWWLGSGRAVAALRPVLLLAALAGFLAGLEGRVIFHSFGQYVRLAPPWSYAAVAAVLYGVAALALLAGSGAGAGAAAAAAGPVLMAAAAVGALAAGAPPLVLPLPLAGAAALALFVEAGSGAAYAAFVACALGSLAWFLWHHFWFLSGVAVGGLPLRALCGLALAAAAPAAALPGLVAARAPRAAVAAAAVAQAAALAFLEEALFAGDHAAVTHNVHAMLPPYVVAATTGAGLLAARALRARGAVGDGAHYLLVCIYASKAAMLFLPEARLTVPVLALALAATPPLLLRGGGRGGGRPRPPPGWQGAALAALVVAAVAAARFAVFDVAAFVLDRRPPEALLAGWLALLAAAGCAPLVVVHYPGSRGARRALLLAAAAGVLLVVLRPPLPAAGGARCPRWLPWGLCPRLWNEAHAPGHEEDDAAIYGDGLRRREHWPLWLLAGAAFSGLVAVTAPPGGGARGGGGGGAPLPASRALGAAAAAGLAGAYLALEFFPGMPAPQGVVLGSALATAALLALLTVPAAAPALGTRSRTGRALGAAWLALFAAWGGSLPVAWAAAAAAPLPALPPGAARLFPDDGFGREVDAERREAVLAAATAVYAAEALLLALALRLRVAAAHRGGGAGAGAALPRAHAGGAGGAALDRAAGLLAQCVPAGALAPGAALPPLRGAGGAALARLSAAGLGWAPTACNAAAALCFALALGLARRLTLGASMADSAAYDAAVLAVAPLLLLLCQDPLAARGLTEVRRYFPPAAAAAVLLAASAGAQLLDEADSGIGGRALPGERSWWLAKNGACLAAVLPATADVLAAAWAGGGRGGGAGRAAALAPLALAAAAATDVAAARFLGALAAVGVAAVAALASQRRAEGRKAI